MPRRFPNEIFDAVIASLSSHGWLSREDRQTLLNCTLVCRDWLPASRHALFSHVELTTPVAWDSFLRWVVNAEAGRPWLTSIRHLELNNKWRDPEDGKDLPAKPMSKWRGQDLVPVLAGHLPNLELLWLDVDWDQCPPHPATFGMFSQFASLRELRLWGCCFPSFSTFRRVLVSLPALQSLTCFSFNAPWSSARQASISAIPSTRPALQTLCLPLFYFEHTLTILEWLVHTPTRSTLVDLTLGSGRMPLAHRITPPDWTLDYYVRILAPSLHRATFWEIRTDNIACNISLDSFTHLKFLEFTVDGTSWLGVADTLRPLPARLDTLVIHVQHDEKVMDSDMLVKEDGEVKAMRVNGLEALEPVLSRENFKDLRCLRFVLDGYADTLEALRESTLEAIQRKLPNLHSRVRLDIRLELFTHRPLPPPSPKAENSQSAQASD